MKKVLLVAIILLSGLMGFSEKLDKYTASTGDTYTVGDTIKLGRGSGINGSFVYLQMGGLFNTLSAMSGTMSTANGRYREANRTNTNISAGLGKNFSGLNVILKKIKQQKFKGGNKIVFVVGGGNITNYDLMIEEALATGEVASSVITSDQALSELKKEKDKLDLGLITQTKYDSLKVELSKYIK